jgi:hypothetical protein
MPDHSTLTGAELHEPKGISLASSNEVYVANGTGSGSWGFQQNECYGAMRFVEVSKEFNIAAADTYYPVNGATLVTPGTLWVTGQVGDCVTFANDGNNERLVVDTAGDYAIVLTLSFTGLVSSSLWGMTAAVNGTVPSNIAVGNSTVANNATQHISIQGIVTLAANDYVQIALKNIGATNNCDLESGILSIHLLNRS